MIRTTDDGNSHTPCALSAHGVCRLHWVAGVLGLACLVSLVGCGEGRLHKSCTAALPVAAKTFRVEKCPLCRSRAVPRGSAMSPIVDGQYRIDARGGVPLGKYRVQVDARKKTGRKVEGFNGFEKAMIDEEVRVGPERYANQHSPLTVDVRADSDGQFDIAIPRE